LLRSRDSEKSETGCIRKSSQIILPKYIVLKAGWPDEFFEKRYYVQTSNEWTSNEKTSNKWTSNVINAKKRQTKERWMT
jgi:hypothetical protein